MELNAWTKNLRAVYDKAISLYRVGNRNDATYFSDEEKSFLNSIGLRPIHVYDYVEDFVTSAEPDWETFLLIIAARRDYFLFERKVPAIPPRSFRTNCRLSVQCSKESRGCHELSAKPAAFWKELSAMTSCTAAAETATFSENTAFIPLTS